TWCERFFMPWIDMIAKMKETDLPLFSLESNTPANQFDILGFTLQYEMSYSNIIHMLQMGNIDVYAKDRDITQPLIIAGGPCAFNAEPVAEFFDIIMLGDGENMLPKLVDLYIEHGKKKTEAFFTQAAQIKGVYIPAFYEAHYSDGYFSGITVKEGAPRVVEKSFLKDMDRAPWPKQPIVPFLNIVFDRVTMEIFRGCTRGCRFCQAGMIYRPLREKSVDKIVEQSIENINATGCDELSLTSLSTGDYPDLVDLIKRLIGETASCPVSISLPSLRIDAYAKEFMELDNGRKHGLTLAPEAGTQRLRDVVNKNVTEEDLLNSVTDAFNNGYDTVKLYFMIGLPTETFEDLDGIYKLTKLVQDAYYRIPKEKRRRKVRITVSASSFVPKSNTPFERFGQNSLELLKEKQVYLGDQLRTLKGVMYNYHDANLSEIESVFARGDRRLAKVIVAAANKGCIYDGWSEYFDYQKWTEALTENEIDYKAFAQRSMDFNDPVPWGHLDCGVTNKYLEKEWNKAINSETTIDCRENCLNCGINNIAGDNALCGR
ncbi:MAG: TIGR03960 family B12-binding radical SAM protein, partial [Clostridiales bacterium]|nr:TIGR03960 family B12-binding radical SAM protein [Clostridiales bacterium]